MSVKNNFMWSRKKWFDSIKNCIALASVGTPSFNLSASEASHGDLGMISKDILILISNSVKQLN